MKVDLTKDLQEFIDVHIGELILHQRVVNINLYNTCYHCQSYAHKIWDCPLMVRRFKEQTLYAPLIVEPQLLLPEVAMMDGKWFLTIVIIHPK